MDLMNVVRKIFLNCLAALVIVFALKLSSGSVMTPFAFEWFYSLRLPLVMPPRIVFEVAWGVIYGLIAGAIANVLICYSVSEIPNLVLIFLLQAIFHVGWGFVFFGMQQIEYGFYTIIALTLLVMAMIVETFKVSKFSAFLLLPYLVWMFFASYLNYVIMVINP